jgi:type II secretory pathway pseudopilin PulG
MKSLPRTGLRRGLSTIWALSVLTLVVGLGAAGLGQLRLNRQQADLHRSARQVEFLARSGVEMALERLTAKPRDYEGETFEAIPKGEVKIVVKKVKDQPDLLTIESQAVYPKGEPSQLRKTHTRTVKMSPGSDGRVIPILQPGN